MTEELHSKVWNQSNRNYFAREREITYLRYNICFFLPKFRIHLGGWVPTCTKELSKQKILKQKVSDYTDESDPPLNMDI